jgi:hypothetical protein
MNITHDLLPLERLAIWLTVFLAVGVVWTAVELFWL